MKLTFMEIQDTSIKFHKDIEHLNWVGSCELPLQYFSLFEILD